MGLAQWRVEKKDKDEAFDMKKMLLLYNKEEVEEIEKAEEFKIWENDIEGLYGTNELAPVSTKTSIKAAKERKTDNFDKFMVYKVDKENADVITFITKSHPVDREVTNYEAVQDVKSQSSGSNQEQGLSGSNFIQEHSELTWMLSLPEPLLELKCSLERSCGWRTWCLLHREEIPGIWYRG